MPKGIYLRKKKLRKEISQRNKRLGIKPPGLPKGKPHTEELKRKIKESEKGKILSEKTKKKIGKANKGKYRSVEFKERCRRQMHYKGEKHWNWQGGITFEPYSVDWTDTLKRGIRERDHYTCQLCGKEPAISVHHIDYNKKNCSPENLITLCNGCHTRTNFRRKYWTSYFMKRRQ